MGRLIDDDYVVTVDDEQVGDELAAVLADSVNPDRTSVRAADAHVVEVVTVGADQYDVHLDGEITHECVPRLLLIATVSWLVNQRSLERALADAEVSGSFVLHAGAVELDGRGVLLVGESQAGKSTAAVGLGREGFGYLSDDVVVLDRHGMLRGSRKPVGLRPGGREVLGVDALLERSDVAGLEYLDSVAVAASTLGLRLVDSVPAAVIVLVAAEAGPGGMVPVRRSIALARLVEALFGEASMNASRLALLAGLIRTMSAFQWSRSTVGDLAATLRDILEES